MGKKRKTISHPSLTHFPLTFPFQPPELAPVNCSLYLFPCVSTHTNPLYVSNTRQPIISIVLCFLFSFSLSHFHSSLTLFLPLSLSLFFSLLRHPHPHPHTPTLSPARAKNVYTEYETSSINLRRIHVCVCALTCGCVCMILVDSKSNLGCDAVRPQSVSRGAMTALSES